MSIFRLLIASLIFCFASFVQAGVLYKGICHPSIEKVADIYKSELSAKILGNGKFLEAVEVYPSDTLTIKPEYILFDDQLGYSYIQSTLGVRFPECSDNNLNDAISLAWKIILVWLAAWAIAQLIRIVRTESDGASDYGHS